MIGKTLGHYRVGEQLGRGGMGEVYVADDLNLNRKVALKFLPDVFAGDPDRMARFEREAKLLASLNHPNIAAIYGLEQAEGKRFIVMELAEGETLAQRLSKERLAVDEALGICRQIADGLESAHEKGVIHRDLKPANVMIAEGDKVKILDFGLAKALSCETQSFDSSHSPTITEAMTQPGVILGTAAYMAPEQAKGKAVDKRADIWAFGCILYECLTGKRAFEGETVTETLAAILKAEPDLEKVPAKVRPVLRRCLEKDSRKRLRDIGEAMAWIESTPEVAQRERPWLAWSISGLLLIALALLSPSYFRQKAPLSAEPMRFHINLADNMFPSPTGAFALSPDGRRLVFAAVSDGVQRLWMRPIGSLEARPVSGVSTIFALPFFWSPDNRFVGMGAEGRLIKIDFSGSPPQIISDISSGAIGGSWNNDGVIIFGDLGGSRGIMRTSAAGGSPSLLTRPNRDRSETYHNLPVFLPDGRHFLYFCESGIPGNTGMYIGTLDSKPEGQNPKRLLAATSGAIYIPSEESGPGYLLFIREQTLMAQRFDGTKLETRGEPIAVAEHVGSYGSYGFFSASNNGTLVYRQPVDMRPTWIDRTGRELAVVGEPGEYKTFDLSADADRLVVSKGYGFGQQNLWVMDLLRGSTTRLTLEKADHSDPRWSPDGRQIMFKSTAESMMRLFRVSLPTSIPVQVFKFEGRMFGLDDWSPDGRCLLYHSSVRPELWSLPLTPDSKPVLVTSSLSGIIDQAKFSPDGRWIAYNTNESGSSQIWVVPFPPTGEKWQLSISGGVQPTWRRDGRELYFLSPDASLMAVDVQPGKTFKWEEAHPLFKTQVSVSDQNEQYAPAPDGKRFLFINPVSERSTFEAILNWTSLLKK